MQPSLLARSPRQSSQTAGAAGDKCARRSGRPPAPSGTASCPWPENVPELVTRWNAGENAASIAARFGISRNAVIGKARTLREAGYELTKRDSPIKRGLLTPGAAGGAGKAIGRPRRATVSPSDAVQATSVAAAPPPARGIVDLRNSANSPSVSEAGLALAAPAASVSIESPPIRSARVAECCWPIGDPGTKPFRFCDAAALRNRPYCEEHAGTAYQTDKWKRPQQEEAA